MLEQVRVQATTKLFRRRIFFLRVSSRLKSQDSYRQATYEEEKFSLLCDPEAALHVQGTNSNESNVTSRSAHYEHVEVTSRWAEG